MMNYPQNHYQFKSVPLVIIFCLLYLGACTSSQKETETVAVKSQEWQPLFKVENLEGWSSVGSAEASIEDSVLTIRRNADAAGWLFSTAQPANFELRAEYKLKPGTNSGVAVRVPTQRSSDPTSSGYEINLDNRSDIQNPSGTIDFLARAFWTEGIDQEGWNRLHILADGDHVQVKVNDQKVAETFSRRSMQGAIALQAPWGDQGEVSFRNIELKELAPSSITQPLIDDYMRSTYKRNKLPIFNGENLEGWHTLNNASWAVLDEQITGDSRGSEGGYLCTDSIYQNFYLSLKFKIAYEDNSGVFIRLKPEAEEVSLDVGLEVNVYDAPGLTWAHPTGSINTHARAFAGLVDYNDWNMMEIFAFDEQITVYVNGIKAAESLVPEAYQHAGNICLQVYPRVATDGGPSQVSYKDIMLKNFDEIPFIGY